MPVRGVRGAVTAPGNSVQAIHAATVELLSRMLAQNAIDPSDLAAVFFSSTSDLNNAHPATAARTLPGFNLVPLFGTCELNPPGTLPMCIRILALWNTDSGQSDIQHVFLGAAAQLRPDLTGWTAGDRQGQEIP